MAKAELNRSTWEERSLERSLAGARARSEAQSQRLVAAAHELVAEVGPDFTVPQVATRAGVSLKTLYRCFAGKDQLLLAVFEEDNRVAADLLAQAVAKHERSTDRLRALVEALFGLATGTQDASYIGAVMREYFRLSQEHSDQVEVVLSPFVDLLEAELLRAEAEGAFVLGEPRRHAAALFLTVVSHLCPLVLADAPVDDVDAADFVSRFCLRALGMDP